MAELHLRKGQRVAWKWLGRLIEGKVLVCYTSKVKQQIKGKQITRNGSPANPAYLVESEAGNLALKLGTELILLNRKKVVSGPKIFR